MRTTSQILREAARYLLLNFGQMALEDPITGAVCVLGSIQRSILGGLRAYAIDLSEDERREARSAWARDGGQYAPAVDRLAEALDIDEMHDKIHAIAAWNDTPGRTRCEVARVLLRAAARAEREEIAHDSSTDPA